MSAPRSFNPITFNFTDWFQQPEKAWRAICPRSQELGYRMIFRAIFWIGLVAFLMPHEPDLGFGRPGTNLGAAAPGTIGGLIQSTNVQAACDHHAAACAGSLSILDGFQAVAVRSLDEVRADIEANRHTVRHGI